MTLVVSDTNIFIDMEVGGVLDEMFALPERFAVPDILFREELEGHFPDLITRGLEVMGLSGESIAVAVRLKGVYRHPCLNDLFALSLARQEACSLLTGDMKLREAAGKEGVEVRGTLWLVGKLVDMSILTPAGASTAYRKMRRGGRRLPWKEVNDQLRTFGEKGIR